MVRIDAETNCFEGPAGQLPIAPGDEVARKLGMLVEGICHGLGPTRAARKYGYTKQHFYQVLKAYEQGGAMALQSRKRGPKRRYRRTDEVVRQVIRHRFLDPNASPEVIAQKLNQCGHAISVRSVNRVIAQFGIQKKTPQVPPRPEG